MPQPYGGRRHNKVLSNSDETTFTTVERKEPQYQTQQYRNDINISYQQCVNQYMLISELRSSVHKHYITERSIELRLLLVNVTSKNSHSMTDYTPTAEAHWTTLSFGLNQVLTRILD